jgi:lysophospholipase L1-like esterase
MKKIIIFIFLVFIVGESKAQYNPTIGQTFNKPMAPQGAFPSDMRTYMWDASRGVYRQFQSTTELLTYFPVAQTRVGNVPYWVNTGSLQSNGFFIGGQAFEYMFRNGVADSNLVLINIDPVTSTGTVSNITATNNAGQVWTITSPTTTPNLSLALTLGGDISGPINNVTVNKFNGLTPADYLNYNNLTNQPTIPAQFNPIAGANISLSGTYPNITFASTGAVSFVRGSGANANYLSPQYTPPTSNPVTGGNDSVGIGTPSPQALFQVAGGRSIFDTIQIRNPYRNDTASLVQLLNYDGTSSYTLRSNFLGNDLLYPNGVPYDSAGKYLANDTNFIFTDLIHTGVRHPTLTIGSESNQNPYVQVIPSGISVEGGNSNFSYSVINSGSIQLSNQLGYNFYLEANPAATSLANGIIYLPELKVPGGGDSLMLHGDSLPSKPIDYVTQYQFDTSSAAGNLQGVLTRGNTSSLPIFDQSDYPLNWTMVGDTIPQLGSDSMWWWGDSQVAWVGVTSRTDGVSSKTANAINSREVNRGIPGTTFCMVSAGDSSFVNRFYEVPNYSTNYRYIVIFYGQNDPGAGVSLSTFQATYSSYMDSLHLDRGYPYNKIICAGVPIRRDASSANPPIWSAAIQTIALAKGCYYINIDSAELANGYNDLFYDNIHKNAWGQTIQSEAFLVTLPDKHGGFLTARAGLEGNTLTLWGNRNVYGGNPSYLNINDTSSTSVLQIRGSGPSFNLFVGGGSGSVNTTADYDVTLGPNSLANITSGGNNTVVGAFAGYELVSGNYDVIIGSTAAENANFTKSIAIGPLAGLNNTSTNNIFLGAQSGDQSDNATITLGHAMVVGGDSTNYVANLYGGSGFEATQPHSFTVSPSIALGSNISGSNLIINPGLATGSGTSGSVIINAGHEISAGTQVHFTSEVGRFTAVNGTNGNGLAIGTGAAPNGPLQIGNTNANITNANNAGIYASDSGATYNVGTNQDFIVTEAQFVAGASRVSGSGKLVNASLLLRSFGGDSAIGLITQPGINNGIGTYNPQQILDVNGNVLTRGAYMFLPQSTLTPIPASGNEMYDSSGINIKGSNGSIIRLSKALISAAAPQVDTFPNESGVFILNNDTLYLHNLANSAKSLTLGNVVLNGDTTSNNIGIGKLPGFVPLAVKGQITSDTLTVSTRAVINGTIFGAAQISTGNIKVSGLYNNVYGSINKVAISAAGSGYVNGTYTSVPLTGGSGTGAQATIVVSGTDVSSITITNNGANYLATDVLSASNSSLGGTGSGFLGSISSIANSLVEGSFIGTTFTPYNQLFSLTGNEVFGNGFTSASADSGFKADVRGTLRSNTFIQSGDTSAQLAGSNTIYVVGNSITAGTGASQTWFRYANRLGAALNCSVVNRGIGGTTAYRQSVGDSSLVDRLLNNSTYIIPGHTSSTQWLILEYGTNDLVSKTITTAQYQSAIVAGIDTAIAHGWPTNRIVLMSVGYWVDTSSYNTTEQPLFAAALQATALANNCIFVNNYQNMLWNGAANDLFSPSTYNVHPNDQGHRVWAEGALALMGVRHGGDENVNGQFQANMVNIYPYPNYNQWTPAFTVYDTTGSITASIRGSNSSTSLLFGYDAGYQSNNSATANSMFGWATGLNNVGGNSNSYFGEAAGELGVSGVNNAEFGKQSGLNSIGSNLTLFGTQSGSSMYGNTNIALGYRAGYTWNTGNGNIIIGNSIQPPTYNSSNTLTIGNVLYGTGIDLTGDSTQSTTGRIGINTNSPSKTLDVNGSALIRTGATLWGLPSATTPSSDSALVVEAGVVKTKLVQLDTLEALTSNATNATTSSSPIFSFNMVSGHTYAVDCRLVVGNSSALGAASVNVIAASGSATGQVTAFGETTTSSTFTNIQAAIGSPTSASFIALLGIGMVNIQGTITCTGSGSATVGFAANGNGTTTVYSAGSYCRFTQIN